MVKKLTPELVKKFSKYMLKKYDARVINKDDAWEMELVAHALDLMDVMDSKEFMDNYAVTLGNRIYLPFEIGSNELPLHLQVECLVHELHHVRQWRNDPKFALMYLISKSDRAHYEAEALSANLEMYWWYSGKLYNTAKLADSLRAYRVRKADIRVTAKSLKVHGYMVKQGGVYRRVSKVAIKYLNAQLRRRGSRMEIIEKVRRK